VAIPLRLIVDIVAMSADAVTKIITETNEVCMLLDAISCKVSPAANNLVVLLHIGKEFLQHYLCLDS